MTLLVVLFTILAAVGRLIPHLPNVAPIGALALFSGAYMSKRWRWVPALVAMLVSDVLLGFDSFPMTLTIYASFIAITLLGAWVGRNSEVLTVGFGSVTGSTIFYIMTNFAVWVFSGMYAHTFSGLVLCYTFALPFFAYTLLGDLGWTVLFFGTARALNVVRRSQLQTLPFDAARIPSQLNH